MHHIRVPHALFCDGRTQLVVLSAPIAKSRMENASLWCIHDVFRMLRRPSAASLTVPVGAPQTPWNVTETAISGEPMV